MIGGGKSGELMGGGDEAGRESEVGREEVGEREKRDQPEIDLLNPLH